MLRPFTCVLHGLLTACFILAVPACGVSPSGSYLSVSADSASGDFTALAGQLKGLASWYRANSVSDSTNGTGWCGKPYTNQTMGFAPPLNKMSPTLATWGTDPAQWKIDTKKWCGLEARVTNPDTGKSVLLTIVDGFDPYWVKTEFAIDILLGPFTDLAGDPKGDKNIVVHDMEWELTGKRNEGW